MVLQIYDVQRMFRRGAFVLRMFRHLNVRRVEYSPVGHSKKRREEKRREEKRRAEQKSRAEKRREELAVQRAEQQSTAEQTYAGKGGKEQKRTLVLRSSTFSFGRRLAE